MSSIIFISFIINDLEYVYAYAWFYGLVLVSKWKLFPVAHVQKPR